MGKSVLITGTSKGLGLALVKRFLEDENWDVIGTSRQGEATYKHARFQHLPIDISSDYEQIPDLLNGKQLDLVINNAAVLQNKSFGQYSADDLQHQFQVNVFTPFLLLQSLSPLLKMGSHVLNIGSMGGYQGSVKFPGLSAYSASKGALAVFTECLAEEWKARQIFVNCLALGSVNTEMLAEAFPGYTAPVNPNQMADFIYSFGTGGHQFFNGKIIPVSVTVP